MNELEIPQRLVEVEATTGRKPRSVDRMRDWEYLERQLHRLICAYARFFADWGDIVAVHRQIWEQSQCVRRLRDRLCEFPGAQSNLEQPASARLEALANHVLLAPSHQDAVDGIWSIFSRALTRSYAQYVAAAHPVHDAPTLAMLNEILTQKEAMRLWLRDHRRRYPHTTDRAYQQRIESALAECGELLAPLPPGDEVAHPVGVRTNFRLPRWPARPAGSRPRVNFRPYVELDFATHVEARRLFWCYGYMLEMNLAMDQVCWLYDGHFMPWEFHEDISRHLWDESRHGDSGMSRLLDFGITLSDVGSAPFDSAEPFEDRIPLLPQANQGQPGALPASQAANPLSPKGLYDAVFGVGMIGETGHFQVKREAYDDFKAGGDLESAEMMLFDIIDEQTHVQYAHRWLPVLAEKAGLDTSGYRELSSQIRESCQNALLKKLDQARQQLMFDASSPGWTTYQDYLQRMRTRQPMANADDRTPRSPLPM